MNAIENKIQVDASSDLYLDLLKRTLCDLIYIDDPMSLMIPVKPDGRKERVIWALLLPILGGLKLLGFEVVRRMHDRVFHRPHFTRAQIRKFRVNGLDQPPRAHTMIGLKRLDNLQVCIDSVLNDRVPGDFLETGVWRGGASIFMKGMLKARGDTERKVWLADSFRGLPPPDAERFPADRGAIFHLNTALAVSLETVRDNFISYGLLDERVVFLKGWFKDTLPKAPISTLALLRLDGDLYESTIDVLNAMYTRVSAGGYIIIDDYGLACCRTAVTDFRNEHSISDPIVEIDGIGAYWRKAAGPARVC